MVNTLENQVRQILAQNFDFERTISPEQLLEELRDAGLNDTQIQSQILNTIYLEAKPRKLKNLLKETLKLIEG